MARDGERREEECEEAQAAAVEALERGGPGFGSAMAADQAGVFLGIDLGIDLGINHGSASWRGVKTMDTSRDSLS